MDNLENKTVRVHMLMSPSEAEAIDDWGFSHRIRTRAEAMRRLCAMALQTEKISPKSMLDIVYDLDTLMHSISDKISELNESSVISATQIADIRSESDQMHQVVLRTKNKLAEYAEARGNPAVASKLRTGMSDRIGSGEDAAD